VDKREENTNPEEEIASSSEATINPEETKDSYKVGYGRPPKKTRFRKGVSGNPTGRSKKLLDFDAALLREGRKFITVNKKGRSVRISKHDVVVNQVVLNAMKGTASDRRLYRDAYRQAAEKATLLDAQQSSDFGKYKSVKELTDEQLMWLAAQGLPEPQEER
jgi:hypothetical protein